MTKHSGLFTSSRLTAPKVGSSAFTTLQNPSMSFASTSMSKTSMSANFLKRTPLPSITGFEAYAPMSPRPSTAVPLEITATRFLRVVEIIEQTGALRRHGEGDRAAQHRTVDQCDLDVVLVAAGQILAQLPLACDPRRGDAVAVEERHAVGEHVDSGNEVVRGVEQVGEPLRPGVPRSELRQENRHLARGAARQQHFHLRPAFGDPQLVAHLPLLEAPWYALAMPLREIVPG